MKGDGTTIVKWLWVEGTLPVYDDETEEEAIGRLGATGFRIELVDEV